jgi:hypothetical protein
VLPYIIGFGALSALAWRKAGEMHGEAKVLPPSIQYALGRLLDAKLPAEKYIKAAEKFEKHGLRAEGELLRKRAKLAALPKSEKMKITNAFGKAMASNKPEGIRAVADALEQMGAVGAATTLREQADKVQSANSIPAVPSTIEIVEVETSPLHEQAIITDDSLQEESELIAAADLNTPPLDVPNPGDLASGPSISPGTGAVPEALPPLAITDDISVEPVDNIVPEEAVVLGMRPTTLERAAEIDILKAPIDGT